MNLQLSNPGLVPPGGWRYTQSESEVLLEAPNFPELLKRVEAHRRANDYDLSPGWKDRVETEICAALNLDCLPRKEEPLKRVVKWSEVFSFVTTVSRWLTLNGGQCVEPKVAERRAAICAACPNNIPISGCVGCHSLTKLVERAIGKGRETSHDEKLEGCRICGCTLKAKIHVPKEAMQGEKPLAFPDHCWMLSEDKTTE